jgi:hypothetical protein
MRTCWILLLVAPMASAEIIDRIAVVVGNSVITESQLLREIRLTGFLNAQPLNFSRDVKTKTADRLVEQTLMRKEIELSRYPPPDPAQVDRIITDLKKDRFQAEEQYQKALKQYGITADDLKTHVEAQLVTLQFIKLRFEPGIRVSDEDVRKAFEQGILPELRAEHADQRVNFEDVREKIQEKLVGERVDQQLDAWLKQAKARTQVEFRWEALNGPAS